MSKIKKRITKREELILDKQYLKVYSYDVTKTVQFTCFRILKHFWRYCNEDNSYAWYVLTKPLKKEDLLKIEDFPNNSKPSLIPSKYFIFLNDMGIDNPNSPNSCYELTED